MEEADSTIPLAEDAPAAATEASLSSGVGNPVATSRTPSQLSKIRATVEALCTAFGAGILTLTLHRPPAADQSGPSMLDKAVMHVKGMRDAVGKDDCEDPGGFFLDTICTVAGGFPTRIPLYACLMGSLAKRGEASRLFVARVLKACADEVEDGSSMREKYLLSFLVASVRASGDHPSLLAPMQDLHRALRRGQGRRDGSREARLLASLHASLYRSPPLEQAEETGFKEDQRVDRVSRLEDAHPLLFCSRSRSDPRTDRVALGSRRESGHEARESFRALLNACELTPESHPEFVPMDLISTDSTLETSLRALVERLASATDDPCGFDSAVLPRLLSGSGETPREQFLTQEICLDLPELMYPRVSDCGKLLMGEVGEPEDLVRGLLTKLTGPKASAPPAVYYASCLRYLCKAQPEVYQDVVMDSVLGLLSIEPETSSSCLDPDVADALSSFIVFHAQDLPTPQARVLGEWDARLSRPEARALNRRSRDELMERVLDRLDALSNRQELMEKLTPSLLGKLTPFPRLPSVATPYFADPSNLLPDAEAERYQLGPELMEFLRTKPSPESLKAWAEERTEGWSELQRVELGVAAALTAAKTSFTHTKGAIERVAPLLRGATGDELLETGALQTTTRVWSRHPSWACFALACLVDAQVVSKELALTWLLTHPDARDALRWWRFRAADDVLARVDDASALVASVLAKCEESMGPRAVSSEPGVETKRSRPKRFRRRSDSGSDSDQLEDDSEEDDDDDTRERRRALRAAKRWLKRRLPEVGAESKSAVMEVEEKAE